ncbi:hypothetical protein PENTCL1PPCAC_30441, partial [Pristionchus entomophagus]
TKRESPILYLSQLVTEFDKNPRYYNCGVHISTLTKFLAHSLLACVVILYYIGQSDRETAALINHVDVAYVGSLLYGVYAKQRLFIFTFQTYQVVRLGFTIFEALCNNFDGPLRILRFFVMIAPENMRFVCPPTTWRTSDFTLVVMFVLQAWLFSIFYDFDCYLSEKQSAITQAIGVKLSSSDEVENIEDARLLLD